MPSKTRTKSNVLKNYEECLKQGITRGKIYGSDFTDGFIIKRYTYPPYPWNSRSLLSTDKKVMHKQTRSEKSYSTVQKKIKAIAPSKKVKSKSAQSSKNASKKQRSKSRKR